MLSPLSFHFFRIEVISMWGHKVNIVLTAVHSLSLESSPYWGNISKKSWQKQTANSKMLSPLSLNFFRIEVNCMWGHKRNIVLTAVHFLPLESSPYLGKISKKAGKKQQIAKC